VKSLWFRPSRSHAQIVSQRQLVFVSVGPEQKKASNDVPSYWSDDLREQETTAYFGDFQRHAIG
jgi:hypothetical protein